MYNLLFYNDLSCFVMGGGVGMDGDTVLATSPPLRMRVFFCGVAVFSMAFKSLPAKNIPLFFQID